MIRTARRALVLVTAGALAACAAQPGDAATRAQQVAQSQARSQEDAAVPEANAAVQVPDGTSMPGPAAPGMKWKIDPTPTFCEEPAKQGTPRQIAFPDSASAVAAAFRALGSRANDHMKVRTLVKTGDGVFLQLFTDTPRGLDGSASVYVAPGPCVTILGW
jgi:hypothetical protein